MNRIIAVLLKHCRCREKGTNIVAGIKCIYRRKYGINAGVTKPGASIVLSEVSQRKSGARNSFVSHTPRHFSGV